MPPRFVTKAQLRPYQQTRFNWLVAIDQEDTAAKRPKRTEGVGRTFLIKDHSQSRKGAGNMDVNFRATHGASVDVADVHSSMPKKAYNAEDSDAYAMRVRDAKRSHI